MMLFLSKLSILIYILSEYLQTASSFFYTKCFLFVFYFQVNFFKFLKASFGAEDFNRSYFSVCDVIWGQIFSLMIIWMAKINEGDY